MARSINIQMLQEVVTVLPHRAGDIARLNLLQQNGAPVVTVIGKYNHGKSMLLNALIGQDAFAVADRRTTIALSDCVGHGARWLDAPGLDADIDNDDDRHAMHAAWLHADVRLFVHAAKEGELDAAELALLQQLQADSTRTLRQTQFILSQVDQLPSDDAVQQVATAIGTQVPAAMVHHVSSARYRTGIDADKPLLIERSGMLELRTILMQALQRVPAARAHETTLLIDEIGRELTARHNETGQLLKTHRARQQAQREAFAAGLNAVLSKSGHDLGAMLDTLGFDHAAVPDTAKDAYAVTAGKQERAYIQMAYSRACIDIDGYLAGHGVIGLPTEQETASRALNTVMIAVLGVSVKFRKDLRRMFCTDTGRARLQRDFTHYYELSADRQALAARISATAQHLADIERASAALGLLDQAA